MEFEAENITDVTFVDEPSPHEPVYMTAFEIFSALLSLVGIAADAAVAYTICRYKKLHTVPNIFIASWTFADIFVLLTIHVCYILVECVDRSYSAETMLVFFYEVGYSFKTVQLQLYILTLFDWCFASYFEKSSVTFRKYYLVTLSLVGVLNLIIILVMFGFALNGLFLPTAYETYMFTYLALLPLTAAMHIFRLVQKCRKKTTDYPTATSLTLVTALVAVGLCTRLLYFTHLRFLWIVVDACQLFTSAITFLIMYKKNQEFKACFKQVMECSSNSYTEEIADFKGVFDNSTKTFTCY